MKWCSPVLSGLLLVVTGCSTLQVKRAAAPTLPPSASQSGKTEEVAGVPFYVKKAVCLQTVVWLEPVYTLTLEMDSVPSESSGNPPGDSAGKPPGDGKPPSAGKVTSESIGSTSLSLSQYQSGVTQALMRAVNGGSSESEIRNEWRAVANQAGTPYEPTGFPPAGDRILISNSSDPQVYVDYSQPYYLNARRPLAGSSKLDTKLASDGTLTEASVEVTDTTIESIGTAVKSISGAVTPFAAARSTRSSGPTSQAKLTIAVGGFKHTLSRYDASSSLPCSVGAAEMSPPYRYTRADVSPAGGKADAKADTKGSKISVSGEIVIPDAKPAAGDKKPDTPE